MYYAGSNPAEDTLLHTGTTLQPKSVEFKESVASQQRNAPEARKTLRKASSATSYRKFKENALQSRISENKAMQEQGKDTAKQRADHVGDGNKKVKRFAQNWLGRISVHKGHFYF